MKEVATDDGPSQSTSSQDKAGDSMNAGDELSEAFRRALEIEVRKAVTSNETSSRRLKTVEQAAEYLTLSRREIYNMIASSELPAVKRGRRTMLDVQDLDNWIDRSKR